MHRLSVISLAALLVVGGVLAFVVFASPHVAAAPAQSTGTHTPQGAGTNSTLLTPPPASTGSGDDDGGSGFDS